MKYNFGNMRHPGLSTGLFIHQEGPPPGGGGGGPVSKDAGGALTDGDLQSTADSLSQGFAAFGQQLKTLQDGLARMCEERDQAYAERDAAFSARDMALDAKETLGGKLAREMQIVGSMRDALRSAKEQMAEMEQKLAESADRVIDASILGALESASSSFEKLETELHGALQPFGSFIDPNKLKPLCDIETQLGSLRKGLDDVIASVRAGTAVEAPAIEQSLPEPVPVEAPLPVQEAVVPQSPVGTSSAGEIAAIIAGKKIAKEFWFTEQLAEDFVQAAQHWTRRVIASLKVCYGDTWTRMVPLFFESLRINRDSNMQGSRETNDYSTSELIKYGMMLPKGVVAGRRAAHKVIRLSKLAEKEQVTEQYVALENNYSYRGWAIDAHGENAEFGSVRERFVADALNGETLIAVESEKMSPAVAHLIAMLLQAADLGDATVPANIMGTTLADLGEAVRFVNRLLMHRAYIAEGMKERLILHITSSTAPPHRVVDSIFALFESIGRRRAIILIWYPDEVEIGRRMTPSSSASPSVSTPRGVSRPHSGARHSAASNGKRGAAATGKISNYMTTAVPPAVQPAPPETPPVLEPAVSQPVSVPPVPLAEVEPNVTLQGYKLATGIGTAVPPAVLEEEAAIPSANEEAVAVAEPVDSEPQAVPAEEVDIEPSSADEPALVVDDAITQPAIAEPVNSEPLAVPAEEVDIEASSTDEPALDVDDAITQPAIAEPVDSEPQVALKEEAVLAVQVSKDARVTRELQPVKPQVAVQPVKVKPFEDTQDYADMWDIVYQTNILQREQYNQESVNRFVLWAIAKDEWLPLLEEDGNIDQLVLGLYQRWADLDKPNKDQVSANEFLARRDEDWRVYVEWQRRNKWLDDDRREIHRDDDFYFPIRQWQTAIDAESAWKLFDKLRSATIDGHPDYAKHKKQLMTAPPEVGSTSDIPNKFVVDVVRELLRQEWVQDRPMFRQRLQNFIDAVAYIYKSTMGNGFKFNAGEGWALLELMKEVVFIQRSTTG